MARTTTIAAAEASSKIIAVRPRRTARAMQATKANTVMASSSHKARRARTNASCAAASESWALLSSSLRYTTNCPKLAGRSRPIAALPGKQRAAIVLTYYEDQSNAAAAETMDMNIKAFESLLLRARGALKRALGSDDAGDQS